MLLAVKISGILFIIGGVFWTVVGVTSYASDIQLGIAVSGMNMIGIGAVMTHLGSKETSKTEEPA